MYVRMYTYTYVMYVCMNGAGEIHAARMGERLLEAHIYTYIHIYVYVCAWM